MLDKINIYNTETKNKALKIIPLDLKCWENTTLTAYRTPHTTVFQTLSKISHNSNNLSFFLTTTGTILTICVFQN